MNLKFYIIAVGIAFFSISAYPQRIIHRYERITSDQGLSQNLVWTMLQDRHGFLWFGTKDGLNKYDGYKFSYYRFDPSDSNSISQGHVSNLHECASGLLWICFSSGKVDILDEKTDRIYHLNLSSAYHHGNSIPRLGGIAESNPAEHWIRADNGSLFQIKGFPDISAGGSSAIANVSISYVESFGGIELSNAGPELIFADATGMLVLNTNRGIIGVQNNSVKCIVSYPESEWKEKGKRFINSQAHFDRDSSLWFTYWTTLYKIDKATNVVSHYPLMMNSEVEKVNRPYNSTNSNSTLWSFEGNTIFQINLDKQSIEQEFRLPVDEHSVALRPLSLLVDRGGILWIGTPGDGIVKYNPMVERFDVMPGIKWATNKIHAYELFRQSKNKLAEPKQKTQLNFNERNIFVDRKNRYWIQDIPDSGHSSIRLCLCDSTGRLIKTYDAMHKPFTGMDMNFRACAEDTSGKIWLAGINTLSRFSPDTETLELFYFTQDSFKSIKTPTMDLSSAITIGATCFKDGNDILWFDSADRGLFAFNLNTLEFRSFKFSNNDPTLLSRNDIISLADDAENPNDILWVGTEGGGLNKFDKHTGHIIRYTMHDGLPNNVINGILFDKERSMWLSTNHGICTFNPVTHESKLYDLNDGLQGNEFDRFKYFQSSDGMMFFGGVNGVNAFYPDKLEDNIHIPQVVLTDLRLQSRSVTIHTPNTFLTSVITETKTLVLPFSENVITLEFAALDFSNSLKNLYSYNLDGFSKTWSYPTIERTATYTHLDPGEYVFHVRGSNNDGIWSVDRPVLTIIILPPWYRTWWFFTLACIFIVGTVYLIVHRRFILLERKRKTQEEFARALLESQEAERKRISGELHDSVGQNILLMKNRAHFGIQGTQDIELAHQQLNEIASLAADTLNQVREISHNLRPLHLDRLGLTQSFFMLLDQVERNSSITIQTTINSIDDLIPKEHEVNLFRIVQECLNNVLKHSKATTVAFTAEVNTEAISIIIRDDGVGFDFDQKQRLTRNYGMGLSGLSERAKIIGGKLVITSSPGKGTTTSLRIPLQQKQ